MEGVGIESAEFRRVLGHYPSGVVAITGVDPAGLPVAMVASSFTSVSLDPPLVAFMPAKTSTSYPMIERSGAFCVNVLSAEHQDLSRQLSVTGGDKFGGVSWRAGASGSPILTDALAWIDCVIDATYPVGDHWIVLGRVIDLRVERTSDPLVFFQGGYGRFAR